MNCRWNRIPIAIIADAEPDERGAKGPRRVRARDDVGILEVLEELIDREAEADE